jgi:predicted RNase H-like HicB family nuclease
LFWSDEDGCWIADVPDLRYCSAHGDTPAEALAQVREAMLGWLKVARDRGIPVPEPRYRPANHAA